MSPFVLLLVALAAPVLGLQSSASPARAGVPAARPAVIGTWRAVAFNRRDLPAVERIPATDGWHHYVKLEQAVVTLRGDGRFIASFRFWHHHLQDGTRVPDSPVLSETHRGTYTVRGGTVTFQPEVKRKDRKPVAPLTGTIADGRLQVRYAVRDGKAMRSLRLELARDASW
jgi:nitrite reductase/ring-hydroxylating ferredoxin subunit